MSKENFLDSFWVVFSQVIILFSGVFRALLLPMFFSIESFAHWQTYLLYCSYVGVFTLGFIDGVYLRYGDKDYDELPFLKLRSSIRIFLIVIVLFTVFCITYLGNGSTSHVNLFPKTLAAINISLMGLHGLLTFILQTTHQLKRFAIFSALDKILLLFIICIFFFADYKEYKALLICDIVFKIFVIVLLCWKTKELLLGPVLSFRDSISEFFKNVSVGNYLLLANLLGMLMIGYGRFYLDIYGNTIDFATYSFGISLSSIAIGLVTSLSYVFYPKLKRMNKENYSMIYDNLNLVLSSFLLLSLICYFPIYYLVNGFYAKYIDILRYLNIILACTYLQSKISVLHNTFFKVIRQEKLLFKINLVLVVLLVAMITLFNIHTINIFAIISISFIILFLRVLLSEIYISKMLKRSVSMSLISESIFLMLFVLSTSYLDFKIALLGFVVLIGFWIAIRRGELMRTFNSLKSAR